jgi:hypothetical protein
MPVIDTRVRQAGPQDAVGCLTIYRPYVENTTVSWELDVPTVDEKAERITAACQMHLDLPGSTDSADPPGLINWTSIGPDENGET